MESTCQPKGWIMQRSETCITFLSGVVSVTLDEHLGDYRLSETLCGKFFKLNLGKWEKTLSEDR